MPLGPNAGLGPGGIVLDGDPAPLTERGTAAPTFRTTFLWHGGPFQQLLSSCFFIKFVSIYYTFKSSILLKSFLRLPFSAYEMLRCGSDAFAVLTATGEKMNSTRKMSSNEKQGADCRN